MTRRSSTSAHSLPHLSHHSPTASDPRSRRWRGVRGLVAACVLPVALLIAPVASAGSTPPFTIGPDLAAVVPGSDAQLNLEDPEGNVKELGPLNSNSTKIGVIQNDAVPTLGLTNPNAQVDLRQAWLGSQKDGDGDDWIYFAWERDSNSGSGFISFEFMSAAAPTVCAFGPGQDTDGLIASCNPWANRSAGDFLILWDQQGNSLDLYLRVWTGTAPNLTLSPPVPLDASVSAAAYSADHYRGEAAINVTDAIYGGVQRCLVFANVIPSTVTGNSDSADYKDTILTSGITLGGCASSTVTTPQTGDGGAIGLGGMSIGTGVVAVRDQAVVDVTGGSATPSGSVAFALCKVDAPGLCTSGGTAVGSTTLAGASYPVTVASPVAYVTSVGRYCWRATYTGDSSNGVAGSSDARASECFTVSPVTPTLTTDASDSVLIGASVTDSATLGGLATDPASPVINLTGASGPAAGGTIRFRLYGPSDAACGPLGYDSAATSPSQNVPVSGNGSYSSAAVTPTAAGNHHWVASYSGSVNNLGVTHNASCTDAAEDVVITTVPSSLSSAQTWVPSDSVTVSAEAGGNLAGTVTFTLFANGTCSSTGIFSSTAPVSGASPQTVLSGNAPAQTVSGSFSWQVAYDSTNPAQRDVGPSCHETSALTIANGGSVTSP